MPEATIEEFKDLIGTDTEISENKISMILGSACRKVLRDGIPKTSENFSEMQLYYAAHLLEVSGEISGPLRAKSVGDVSVSFGGTQESSWLDLYQRTRVSIQGIRGRFG